MVRVSLSDRFPGGLAGVGVALAAGVAGVLGSFAAAGFAPGFTVAPVDTALSKVMPGFAITFALQQPLLSLVGWLYIVSKRPYGVGDRVEIGDSRGDVIEVGFLTTTLWEAGGSPLDSPRAGS